MIENHIIKELAPIFGIDAVGVVEAKPLVDAKKLLKKQHYPYEKFELRYKPSSFLKNARSVIVALENYLAHDRAIGDLEGKIAYYTRSNYYYDLRKKLRRMAKVLKRSYRMHYRVFSNGPLAEKPLAVKAGLGYYGKHSIIINDKFGSWVVIGEIITDLDIEPDQPMKKDCGDCRMCMDVCPTRAIKEPYSLDWSRCIQYLSNHRAIIPEDIREVWGNRLYGCTVCQDICPMNEGKVQSHPIPEYGYVGPSLPLLDILILDEKRYRQRYERNQIGARWVELACLKRNAIIALAHAQDPSVIPHIKKLERDSDPILSEHAQWAIAKLNQI